MAIVAVFLPVGLMPGISGQFFKNFGLTIVAAVLLSLAVARLITPMIAAYFLKAHGAAPHGENWLMRHYMRVLAFSLRYRWWTVAAGGLALAATVVSFATLPFNFQPTINTDYSQVRIQMVPGSTLLQTTDVADQATAVLKTAPEVVAAFSDISTDNADIYVTLDHKRKRTSIEVERALAPKLAAIADARVTFQSQSGGLGRDITIMMAGDDPDKLNAVALKIVDGMRGIPELRSPRVDGDLQRPEIVIRPRFDLAADLGVTTAALSQTIRIATLGDIDQNVAKFSLPDRQIPIRVALNENSRRNLSTIENLPVPTAMGGSVPLKVVADIGFGAGPSQLRRYNQTRRIVIGADLAPGAQPGVANPKINELPAMKNLPVGVERVAFGDSKWQGEMIKNFIIAVIFGHAARLRRAGAALPAGDAAVRQHGLAAAGAARRGAGTAPHRQFRVDAGDDRAADAARHRREELHPARRFRARGDGQGRAAQAGDHGCWPQARPADRDDHRGDGRRHGADRAQPVG